MQETIKNINIDLLIPFENHPFKKRDGIEKEELTESVKENGLLLNPIFLFFSVRYLCRFSHKSILNLYRYLSHESRDNSATKTQA